MNVELIGDGTKIPYKMGSKILSLNNDELKLRLEDYQKDVAVFLDVFWTSEGVLQVGSGEAYAANVIIPPQVSREVDTGTVDEDGKAIYELVKDPLNLDDVTLKLWDIPNKYIKTIKEEV